MKLLGVQVTLAVLVEDPKGVYHIEVLAKRQVNLLHLEVLFEQDHLLQCA